MADRFSEEFIEYRCSDCDPDVLKDLGEESEYDKPYVLLVPKGEAYPDYCPRCDARLSLLDSATGLRITNTPYERYVQRHEEAQRAASD